MLTVIGDLVEDVVVWTDGPFRRGTDNPATVVRSRGGSAANVAVQAAALTPTRFVGRVGADAAGEALVQGLVAAGVDVRVQHAGRTGTVVVVVDPVDGERTMYPDRGASAGLEPIDDSWLDGASLVHVPAYGFAAEPAASAIVRGIETVRRNGAKVSIDLSAVTVIERYGRERFVALLDRLAPDVVLANRDEADIVADDLFRPGRIVVVKHGPHPALVVHAGATTAVDAVEIPGVRDTTGAGDAFAAGFLAAWAGGTDPVDACRAGHRVAAAVLTIPGAG